MTRNEHYWTQAYKDALERAQSFTDLVPTALAVLARMPKPISQVCGPISTGGLGSIAKNRLVFDATIDHLLSQGITVFDQMPFQEDILRIGGLPWGKRQNDQLLINFFLPIFESGHVARLYFIQDWQSSEGATWEHEQGHRLGMEIVYLPQLVPVPVQ